jgi:Tfp pilus assembly protein PilZ
MSDPLVRFGVVTHHRLIEDAQQGLTGVFVATSTPAPEGKLVSLRLELPWGERLDLHGQVEWVRTPAEATLRNRPGMGVRCDLTDLERALLQRLRLHQAPVCR